jgi:hypothetical protein
MNDVLVNRVAGHDGRTLAHETNDGKEIFVYDKQ